MDAPPPTKPPASLKEIRKRLQDEGASLDDLLADAGAPVDPAAAPPADGGPGADEMPVEPEDSSEVPVESPAVDVSVAPEVRAQLVAYGPPDTWTTETMRDLDAADRAAMKAAWAKMSPEEQAAVRDEFRMARGGSPAHKPAPIKVAIGGM